MDHRPPTIDMRLDGSFASPAPAGIPWSAKLMLGGIVAALLAGSIAVAALALWVFSLVLPVIVVAGLFAWLMLKFRRWQAQRGAPSQQRAPRHY